MNCIVSDEHLNEYIDFCLGKSLSRKIKGETTSHHILPQAKNLPFKEYKNLKEHPWNMAELTYYDHYYAHYLLMQAVNHYSVIHSFCAMHNQDVVLGRINKEDLISENEFTHWFKLRNKKISKYLNEIIEIDGKPISRAKHNVSKIEYSSEWIDLRSKRMRGNNNIVHLEGVVDKIRKTKLENNLDGISAERAAETMRKEFVDENGNITTKYKENAKKLSATLTKEFVDENGNITSLAKIRGILHGKNLRDKGKQYHLKNVFDDTFVMVLCAVEIRDISPGLTTKTKENYLGMSLFGYNRFMERGTPELIGLYVEELP